MSQPYLSNVELLIGLREDAGQLSMQNVSSPSLGVYYKIRVAGPEEVAASNRWRINPRLFNLMVQKVLGLQIHV